MSDTKELTYSEVAEHSSKKVRLPPCLSPIPQRKLPEIWWAKMLTPGLCSAKQDLYLVVHDKVYNASTFVDEHPYVLLAQKPPIPLAPKWHLKETLRA